jgi:hypothetical protein
MNACMARPAQGDQVPFAVGARAAARDDVVDVELLLTAAHLAGPTVARQHLRPQRAIPVFMQPAGSRHLTIDLRI